MENLRYSIECFWREHGRTIRRYALWVWCLIIGVLGERGFIAWLGLAAILIVFCYDRWLHVWAERGRKLLNYPEPKDP